MELSTTDINIIDAFMGTGKSYWHRKRLNDKIINKEKLFSDFIIEDRRPRLDITASFTLEEANAIKSVYPDESLLFIPQYNGSNKKIDHFRTNIFTKAEDGDAIDSTITHKLLGSLNDDDIDRLEILNKSKRVCITIDESPKLLSYIDIGRMKDKDIEDANILSFDEDGRFVQKALETVYFEKRKWKNGIDRIYFNEEYREHSIEEFGQFSTFLRDKATDGRLLISESGIYAFLHINPRIFTSGFEVTILTHNFKHQMLCYELMRLLDCSIKMFQVDCNGELVEYSFEREKLSINKYSPFINILYKESEKISSKLLEMNKSGGDILTSTWYGRNKKGIEILSKKVNSVFKHVMTGKKQDFCVVTPKKYVFDMMCKDFTKPKTKKNSKRKVILHEDDTMLLPIGTRGTERYSDKSGIAYCYNHYFNPGLVRMWKSFNILKNEKEVEIMQDKMALNALLQTLFRLRIRKREDVSRSIEVLLPTERMMGLLIEYLK